MPRRLVLVAVEQINATSGVGYMMSLARSYGQTEVILVGLLIPSEVTIVPLFKIFDAWGMVDTHWPLILVPIFGAPSVLATFIMRQFFLALPGELEEAAKVDGLGRFAIFRLIALPLARPALLTAGLLVFVDTMKELPATLIVRPFDFDTLAVRVHSLAADERLAEASTAALLIVVTGLLPVVALARAMRR